MTTLLRKRFSQWLLLLMCCAPMMDVQLVNALNIEPAEPSVNLKLAAHQARYAEPKIVKVTDRVYAAVGYDIATFEEI